MDNMINVKICKVPGQKVSFVLTAGTTLREALETAGFLQDVERGAFTVRVGGNSVSQDYELKEGDLVLLTSSVKGN